MQQIGRYHIVGELGRGAMGIVYKAQDPTIGRTIAIKSIRLEELTDESERQRLKERLIREAQSAGILSHPGIVTIYDIAEEGGMAYIFMEFVNGPPLEKMLVAEQPPDKETLLSIFRQTALALDFAHKKGIVHRDIKPANIMIHEDGTAKVTDFGVAKIVSQQMTQAGAMMGTPSYMSPEQVQGGAITGRTDQFSLAVIVYEVLTGDKPFAAEFLPSLLYNIVRNDPIPAQRLNPTLGPLVNEVLQKALSKNSDDRYETCVDFVAALSAACKRTPGWNPLPRGASHNMPTGGSHGTVAADPIPAVTVLEMPKPAPPSTPALEEAPAPPLPFRPEPEHSHAVRNAALLAIILVMLGGGIFYGLKYFGAGRPTEPEPSAESTKPAPAAAVDKAPPVARAARTPTAAPVEENPANPAPAAAAAQPRFPSLSDQVPFQLTTNPPGATAVFDDNPPLTCTTPCTVSLNSGRHTMAATSPGFREARRIFVIPRDVGLIVNLERQEGKLILTSNPPGLTVLIDGKEQIKKTPTTFTLPVGQHRIDALKGGEKMQLVVEIPDDGTIEKNIDWP